MPGQSVTIVAIAPVGQAVTVKTLFCIDNYWAAGGATALPEVDELLLEVCTPIVACLELCFRQADAACGQQHRRQQAGDTQGG